MLFNSFVFWGFFAAVLLLYRWLPHRSQNHMLLVASYIFYGYWDYRFLSLILLSTAVDYVAAKAVASSQHQGERRTWLVVSIATNLGILGFFKYWGFFTAEADALLQAMGFNSALPVLNIILPIGISFYTFQSMSYTIDVYRGQTKPAGRFLDFALYVSFFPQLVAGPIERSSRLLPQILQPRTVDRQAFHEGLYLIISGLFRKVVVADNMAPIVNSIFSRPTSELTAAEVMIGVYAFAFQIYGDFSGYSNIAKGIARWLGFDLMWNFRNPYFAISPSDFWRRWHISLSTWLRDYLYIALGGNRGGRLMTFRNLMLTMTLGGLWHGAAWNFVVWGVYHGLLLIGYRIAGLDGGDSTSTNKMSQFKRVLLIVLMFHLICFSWLLFRADSMEQITGMLATAGGGLGWTPFVTYSATMLLLFAGPLLVLDYVTERKNDLYYPIRTSGTTQIGMFAYMMLTLIIFPPPATQEFIYFQF
ncbi:MBOAT family O-acyltransferase [Thioalkalivibrio sulfidiphilus]|uniref:MBOAT family O-acyltransferase n=1 Tax=Thioalkalivibrio sulfidiphilus TaxID=1033854 RepID=UPI000379B293|nr:MBOAT family O-acyltransferase [Thioalkalivibrio sulfidiphilus]